MKNWKKHRLPLILLLVIIGYSCASIGTPDGGPYDELPPKFIGSNPGMHAVNAKEKKLELEYPIITNNRISGNLCFFQFFILKIQS